MPRREPVPSVLALAFVLCGVVRTCARLCLVEPLLHGPCDVATLARAEVPGRVGGLFRQTHLLRAIFKVPMVQSMMALRSMKIACKTKR